MAFLIAYKHRHSVSDERDRILEHAALQREAQAYFRLLQALETGSAQETTKFRQRAAVVLRAYLNDVTVVQRRYGSNWCPLDSGFYESARKLMATNTPPRQ